MSPARGNDAQATVLHRRASTPALFHPRLGTPDERAKALRNGCAPLDCTVNTTSVIANQG
jgi:hypothetical protein